MRILFQGAFMIPPYLHIGYGAACTPRVRPNIEYHETYDYVKDTGKLEPYEAPRNLAEEVMGKGAAGVRLVDGKRVVQVVAQSGHSAGSGVSRGGSHPAGSGVFLVFGIVMLAFAVVIISAHKIRLLTRKRRQTSQRSKYHSSNKATLLTYHHAP